MSTSTTTYGIIKPTVSGDADLWGGYWNTNGDTMESAFIAFGSDTLSGLTLSAAGSTATFGVAAGFAGAADGYVMKLASAYTKTASSWAVGSGNGSLDTGTIANLTCYHVWLIRRPDTGVVDVLTSLSATSPTMPTNYTQKRRIGAMFSDASAQWTKFVQDGDQFLFDVAVLSSNTNLSTSSQQFTLTVPTGVKVQAIINYFVQNSGGTVTGLYSDGDLAAAAAGTPTNNYNFNANPSGVAAVGRMMLRTDTSGRIRGIANTSSTAHNLITVGWIDRRGRG